MCQILVTEGGGSVSDLVHMRWEWFSVKPLGQVGLVLNQTGGDSLVLNHFGEIV